MSHLPVKIVWSNNLGKILLIYLKILGFFKKRWPFLGFQGSHTKNNVGIVFPVYENGCGVSYNLILAYSKSKDSIFLANLGQFSKKTIKTKVFRRRTPKLTLDSCSSHTKTGIPCSFVLVLSRPHTLSEINICGE